MTRPVFALSLAALLAAAAGCRTNCGNRGWFTSAPRGDAPCNLVGRSGDVCFETIPGGGTVIPGGVIPGAAPSGRADELPMPQPSDLIPRPGVPVPSAVPTPAPPLPDSSMGTLPLPKTGVPVRGGK